MNTITITRYLAACLALSSASFAQSSTSALIVDHGDLIGTQTYRQAKQVASDRVLLIGQHPQFRASKAADADPSKSEEPVISVPLKSAPEPVISAVPRAKANDHPWGLKNPKLKHLPNL